MIGKKAREPLYDNGADCISTTVGEPLEGSRLLNFMSFKFKTINLEQGMPTVLQARARLANELRAARAGGVEFVKIIHGYGSSGIGGELRIALQATLRQMQEHGEIRACIFGENWNQGDERTWSLMKRFPALKDDHDLGRANKGITIVVL